MFEHEIKKYIALNELAETGGTVIFGGTADREIPLCELKQAFSLNENLYTRSISGLSIASAIEIYDSCIVPLKPSCVLLHLGTEDVTSFEADATTFEQNYRRLVQHIKASAPKCTLVIITLKNPENNPAITELNKHLKYIADSERCEFEDISAKRVWNPKETKDIASFVYSTGFVKPLKNHRSIYDLVKILFCYN